MREPMLWPAGALAAGIAAAHGAGLGAAEAFGAACAFGVLAAVSRRLSGAWLWRLCSLLAVAAAGAGLAGLHESRSEPVIDAGPRETVVVAGCVVEPPALLPGRYEFVAELAPGARAVVRVYQDESEAWPELRYGQRVDITGRIRRPRNFLNPGAFDYRRSLERREIYWIISVSRPGDLEPLAGECGSRFWKLVYGARRAALQRLHCVFRDYPRTARLLSAALLGDSATLGEIWKERFRETGTYHTLVVSGLHLTILAGLVHLLLRLLGFSRGWKTVAASALAWAYALLTGGRLPVLRAAGGLTLFLIGSWCFRRPRLLNLLAVVAIVFLIIDPEQLFEASFHLSFLAVGVIGAWGLPLLERTTGPVAAALRGLADEARDPGLRPEIQRWRVELRLIADTIALWAVGGRGFWRRALAVFLRGVIHVWELVLVSAIIQAALALPLVVHFQRFSWTAVAANPVVVLAMTSALQAGLAALVTGSVAAASAAAAAADVAMGAVEAIAGWGASWRVPPPPQWVAAGFLAALAGGAAWLRRVGRRWWAPVLLPAPLLAALLLHPFPPRIEPGVLELTMIDVGQAESLLLVFPDGRTAVVDGGALRVSPDGEVLFDAGADVVAPYLWRRSIRRLDVIASSHGHQDHIGGLRSLLRLFRPAELWLSAAAGDPATVSLEAEARRLGVKVIRRRAGERFDYGGAHVRVLAPPAERKAGGKAGNDDSLVLHVQFGRRGFLLTGDIEAVERRIAASGLPRAAVLKVPHHGSRTSTGEALLRAVRPAMAAVSAGYANAYGFPARDVLERLAAARVLTFSTSRNGLVSFRTDGWRVWADPMRWFRSGSEREARRRDGAGPPT